MKVAELKAELKNRGLDQKGLKKGTAGRRSCVYVGMWVSHVCICRCVSAFAYLCLMVYVFVPAVLYHLSPSAPHSLTV